MMTVLSHDRLLAPILLLSCLVLFARPASAAPVAHSPDLFVTVFFSNDGSFPPDWSRALLVNMVAIFLLYAVLTMIRLRQEQTQREIDYLRRTVHAI